eukprot:TRINITY_DN3468_c0_g1_i1.p1 TRINITY_DN3468_c0_g1~~TRINITY_DN3468_c0_g1_i1.p1  ORF type:complete len:394 (+),score=94.13 TRINITY_DN3468_c0_g1_i1:36-1217(+)
MFLFFLLLIVVLLLVVWLLWYSVSCCASPDVRNVRSRCAVRRFVPHPALCVPSLTGLLHSVAVAAARKRIVMTFTREIVGMPDGGQYALDWYNEKSSKTIAGEKHQETALSENAPVVILLHGLNGGSMESYIRGMVRECRSRGWRPVVLIARGVAGLALKTWRSYNSGFTTDLRNAVSLIHQRYPSAPLLAIGYSLGANILTKFCREEKENCLLNAAVSVSSPLDLTKSQNSMHSGSIGRLFSSFMLKGLKRMVTKNVTMFKTAPHSQSIDFESIPKMKTTLEFDNKISSKLFEMKDAYDYYEKCSSAPYVADITIPFLFLAARDDVVSADQPDNFLVPIAKQKKNISLIITNKGGHIGWFVLDPRHPLSFNNVWCDKTAADYMSDVLEDKSD